MHWFCSHECALFFSNPKRIDYALSPGLRSITSGSQFSTEAYMRPDSRTRRLTAQKLHLMGKITVCPFDGLRNCAILIQCANM